MHQEHEKLKKIHKEAWQAVSTCGS